MRVAVLIIGLVLTFGLFLQAVLVDGLSNAAGDKDTAAAGAYGVLMALIWLVSCGLVIPQPRVSAWLFLVTGIIGIIMGASGDYSDLIFWGIVGCILAVFSWFGFKGKRKADAKEAERDALFRQMAANQHVAPQPAPPSSHAADSY